MTGCVLSDGVRPISARTTVTSWFFEASRVPSAENPSENALLSMAVGESSEVALFAA
jgi:hypothetical protein